MYYELINYNEKINDKLFSFYIFFNKFKLDKINHNNFVTIFL